jgi:hypothetical protein
MPKQKSKSSSADAEKPPYKFGRDVQIWDTETELEEGEGYVIPDEDWAGWQHFQATLRTFIKSASDPVEIELAQQIIEAIDEKQFLRALELQETISDSMGENLVKYSNRSVAWFVFKDGLMTLLKTGVIAFAVYLLYIQTVFPPISDLVKAVFNALQAVYDALNELI